MNTRLILGAVSGALAAAVAVSAATAATVERLDLVHAAAEADQIIHGDVVSTQCVFSDDGLRIYTDAQIDVRESLKGNASTVVTVRTLGGVIGTIGQVVPGAPRLYPGEEVVLLLQQVRGQPSASPPRIVGLGQGLYRVVVPHATGVATAVQAIDGIELVDLGKQGVVGADVATRPLEDLLARLRALAKGAQR